MMIRRKVFIVALGFSALSGQLSYGRALAGNLCGKVTYVGPGSNESETEIVLNGRKYTLNAQSPFARQRDLLLATQAFVAGAQVCAPSDGETLGGLFFGELPK